MLRPALLLPETVLDEERAELNLEWLAGKVGGDLARATPSQVEVTAVSISEGGIGNRVR
jgi:hypothetical protein